ncbi:hypothetical protein QAD02_001755 [Eretmocerus hayati]|uniref:Uncharacterized protein n=1 Tax=Eretmocerus hayati TaxID=131215 RepID=A0ACC2NIP3_9HYME|nr:hypothetical protein QAD02_001755 [Eretmocerus hayati]
MSLTDSYFSEDVQEDLEHFLKSEQRKRVLIFPPVNNYRRFLIHQLVQDRFSLLLQTFSIGQGFARRTVVCYKTDYIGPPQVNGNTQQKSDFWTSPGRMGIENQCSPTASPEHSLRNSKQVRSTPTYEVYRPPAARRAQAGRSPCKVDTAPALQPTMDTPTRSNRQKRPDRAVYVPRHRRGAPDSQSVPTKSSSSKCDQSPIRINFELESKQKSSNHCLSTGDIAPETISSSSVKNEITMEVIDLTSENTNSPPAFTDAPTDKVVADELNIIDLVQDDSEDSICTVEKEQVENVSEKQPDLLTSCDLEKSSLESSQNQESIVQISGSSLKAERKLEENSIDIKEALTTVGSLPVEKEIDVEQNKNSPETDICTDEPLEKKKKDSECTSTNLDESDQRDRRKTESELEYVTMDLVTESLIDEKTDTDLVSKPEEDLNKIDSKPETGISQMPLVSKVLVISTPEEENDVKIEDQSPLPPPETKVKKVKSKSPVAVSPPSPTVKVNRDECDWESLFDDNGDCLDPTLMEELTSAVGEVAIEKPKSTYKSHKPVKISSDEFGHILEIYDFPSEFKSCDLVAAFSSFKSDGFELKWVDDTHCLGVFGSPGIAAEVLASQHPLVKTRPLSEASAISKMKARKSVEKLQPYKARPETCAALARRLVTKSLGVKLSTAKQEREQEKMVLREAKEKKKLANKQREEIWEGIITDNPLP